MSIANSKWVPGVLAILVLFAWMPAASAAQVKQSLDVVSSTNRSATESQKKGRGAGRADPERCWRSIADCRMVPSSRRPTRGNCRNENSSSVRRSTICSGRFPRPRLPGSGLCRVILACAQGFAVSTVAEDGQYRSKILLVPEGEWAKGAELSIEELELQLGSIEDAYAKSSAGRHLAQHYVQRKEYDKAIEYYKDALAAQGLSSIADRAMLRELAQVYLLRKDYPSAVATLQQALAIELVTDVADYLLLARAQHQLGRYVDVVATLDSIQQAGLVLEQRKGRVMLAVR